MIEPDWPAPPGVIAVSTTRSGGVSRGPYASLNLGTHVGDEPGRVAVNRALIRERLHLPSEPLWLSQIHGCRLLEVDHPHQEPQPATAPRGTCEADGAYTRVPGVVCVVLTADCLPVLLCDDLGTCVAAVHVGWRGLAAGILESACATLGKRRPERLIAWLGPAIGPDAFEVGAEVRAQFVTQDPEATEAFRPGRAGRFFADLPALARQRLRRCGVREIHGGCHCTVAAPATFFSYRRDGVTGRMASLIWLDPHGAAADGGTRHA
nr:peptidoglycan editing factor PgeF [Thiocapsa imhoffii]